MKCGVFPSYLSKHVSIAVSIMPVLHPENSDCKLICDAYLSSVSLYHPNLHHLYLFIVSVCVQCFPFASLIYYFVFICIPDKILRKEKCFIFCIFGFWRL